MSRTSSVECGKATASGGACGKYDSSLPWCSRTPREVVTRSPRSWRRSATSAASSSRATFISGFSWCRTSGRCRSLELDLAVELHRQLQRRDLERHLGGKRLVALDRARPAGLGDRLLDRPLRVHAHHLQELADR